MVKLMIKIQADHTVEFDLGVVEIDNGSNANVPRALHHKIVHLRKVNI